ncbi:MAG: chloride channel protein [Blastocatellia bacterium]
MGRRYFPALALYWRYAQGCHWTFYTVCLRHGCVHPGAFALVGMGAFFAGVVRAPVTSIIIIFEMTNNYSMILPLMIANIISYVIAYEISPTPIYDALLLQDNIHLPHNEREVLKQKFASEAMTTKFTALSSDLTLSQAFDYLQAFTDTPLTYPVLDSNERLLGLLTHNDLKRAMAEGNEQLFLHQLTIRKAHAFPNQTLQAVLIKLGRNGLTLLPIVSRDDPSSLLGVITTLDIASALAQEVRGDSGVQ